MSSPEPAQPAPGGAPAPGTEPARRLRVERSRHVPAFSQATWGLAVHALSSSLEQAGLDDADSWTADGGGAPESARVTVRPERDGVRVSLALERATPGSLAWALPMLFWPFAFLLVVLVARGELPWRFWVIPALFGLAPSALLAVRWSAHRAWEALAVRRALRALDAVAGAVADGNRLEAAPGRLFVPEPLDVLAPPDEPVLRALSADDDPAWSAPFVAPAEEPAGLELWISLDEAEALGARLRAGEISLRATPGLAGDGHAAGSAHRTDGTLAALPVVARPPRPWRERRRRPAGGWVRRTLASGFGEWLPDRDGE